MARSPAFVVGLGLAFAGSLVARDAAADDCAKQRDVAACYFREGQTLLDGNKPREAAAQFLASYRLDTSKIDPLASYGIALAKDGQHLVAAEALEKAIESYDARAAQVKAANPGATALVQTIVEHRDVAAAALAELDKHVARVEIAYAPALPPGLTVAREGASELRSSSQTRVVVTPGKDRLLFKLGDKSATVDVTATAGSTARVDAPLAQLVGSEASPTGTPVEPTPPPVVAEPGRSRALLWVGVGAGVAGLVGLGAAAALQVQSSNSWDEAGCDETKQPAVCPDQTAGALAQQSHDQADRARIAAIVGGALLATGITLVIIDLRKGKRSQEAVTARLAPTPDGGWLVFGGRF